MIASLTSRKINQPPAYQCSIEHHESDSSNTEILAQTPDSNTGLNSQSGFTVAVDWLDITFRSVSGIAEVEAILKEAEVILCDEIEFCPSRAVFNGKRWTGSGRGVKGTLIFYDDGSASDSCDRRSAALKIIASGSIIGPVDQEGVAIWLNSRAESNELDCTRIDISMDDHEKFISLRKITQAQKRGNFFNASHSTYIESGSRGQDRGVTLYFGSPQSDKRLRIYDKTIESRGKVIGNRWEAEIRRKAARVALYQWIGERLKDEKSTERWCQDTVTGVIDFRDRSGNDPNRNRCRRLNWFRSLIDRLRATPCRIRVPIPVISVQKSIDWVISAVAPTLSIIRTTLGKDFVPFMSKTISQGGERLSVAKRRLIAATAKEKLIY